MLIFFALEKKHPSESKEQNMLLRGKFNGRFMNVLHSDTPYSETYCMWKIWMRNSQDVDAFKSRMILYGIIPELRKWLAWLQHISCFCYPKISIGLCRLLMGHTSPPTLHLSAWMSFSSMLEADCHNRQEEDHDVMLGKLTDYSVIISSSTLALQISFIHMYIYIQITTCICWMLLVSINCLTHVLVVKGSTVWKGSGIHIK